MGLDAIAVGVVKHQHLWMLAGNVLDRDGHAALAQAPLEDSERGPIRQFEGEMPESLAGRQLELVKVGLTGQADRSVWLILDHSEAENSHVEIRHRTRIRYLKADVRKPSAEHRSCVVRGRAQGVFCRTELASDTRYCLWAAESSGLRQSRITFLMTERTATPHDGPKYPIESVDAALRLLALIHDRRSVSVSSAARHVGVAPSTAHRLLAMLQHYRLVEQDRATKTYRTGPWLLELGLAALRDFDIREAARPHIQALVEEVGETSHLVCLYGADAVFVDCVECSAALRAASRTGQRLPAHCTAAGKVQLAALPPDRVTALYPQDHLEPLTANSIRTRDELLRELARIRKAGYATNRRESEHDLHALAAAITDPMGVVRGAVTVAGPPDRMKPSVLRGIAPAVIRAVEKIGAALASPEAA